MSCSDVPPSASDTRSPRRPYYPGTSSDVQDGTLPGIGPVFPRRPLDRGRLLLARTRELIDARAKVRQLERECGEIIASLHEGR